MKKIIFIIIILFILISNSIVYSTTEDPNEYDYTPLPIVGTLYNYTSENESLYAVASKAQVGVSHIVRANVLSRGWRIKAGTKLVIPRRRILPFKLENGLVLNLPEFTVYVFKNNKLVDFYPVAVGRPSMPTPTGDYELISKVKWPTWTPPPWAHIDHPIPPGPGNPLGKYWMGTTAPGVGLHSTTAPGSIGTTASHGCVRNYPWLAEKLFDLVEIGMPVKIMYKPIKFGFENGKIYMEVHPDIYYHHYRNKEEYITQILEKTGLKDIVDKNIVTKIVEQEKGFPVAIFNDPLKIKRGKKFLKLKYPVIKKDNEPYIALQDFADNFYFKVISEEKDLVILSCGMETIEINPLEKTIYMHQEGSLNQMPIINLVNETYIPLNYLGVSLGFKVSYNSKLKMFVVS